VVDNELEQHLGDSLIFKVLARVPRSMRGEVSVLKESPWTVKFSTPRDLFSASLPDYQSHEVEQLFKEAQLENLLIEKILEPLATQHSFYSLLERMLAR